MIELCDWCKHGCLAEMMELVVVDDKAMHWCPECFGTVFDIGDLESNYEAIEPDEYSNNLRDGM